MFRRDNAIRVLSKFLPTQRKRESDMKAKSIFSPRSRTKEQSEGNTAAAAAPSVSVSSTTTKQQQDSTEMSNKRQRVTQLTNDYDDISRKMGTGNDPVKEAMLSMQLARKGLDVAIAKLDVDTEVVRLARELVRMTEERYAPPEELVKANLELYQAEVAKERAEMEKSKAEAYLKVLQSVNDDARTYWSGEEIAVNNKLKIFQERLSEQIQLKEEELRERAKSK